VFRDGRCSHPPRLRIFVSERTRRSSRSVVFHHGTRDSIDACFRKLKTRPSSRPTLTVDEDSERSVAALAVSYTDGPLGVFHHGTRTELRRTRQMLTSRAQSPTCSIMEKGAGNDRRDIWSASACSMMEHAVTGTKTVTVAYGLESCSCSTERSSSRRPRAIESLRASERSGKRRDSSHGWPKLALVERDHQSLKVTQPRRSGQRHGAERHPLRWGRAFYDLSILRSSDEKRLRDAPRACFLTLIYWRVPSRTQARKKGPFEGPFR
jgi:hypothetical protein